MTFQKFLREKREDILHAFEGEVRGYDEDGKEIWYPIESPLTVKAIVLNSFNSIAYQAESLNDSGKAIERILQNHDIDLTRYFKEYIREVNALWAERIQNSDTEDDEGEEDERHY